MKICYCSCKPVIPIGALTTAEGFSLQRVIENAIHNAIIVPLQNWFLNTLLGFREFSYWICFGFCVYGALLYISGVKDKGKKYVATSIVSYIAICLGTYILRATIR